MYSVIGAAAHELTSLELKGIQFPACARGMGGGVSDCAFSALAGLPIRHLALHVTGFQDHRHSDVGDVLLPVLANLPRLTSLDMSFPDAPPYGRCGAETKAYMGLICLSTAARPAARLSCPVTVAAEVCTSASGRLGRASKPSCLARHL